MGRSVSRCACTNSINPKDQLDLLQSYCAAQDACCGSLAIQGPALYKFLAGMLVLTAPLWKHGFLDAATIQ